MLLDSYSYFKTYKNIFNYQNQKIKNICNFFLSFLLIYNSILINCHSVSSLFHQLILLKYFFCQFLKLAFIRILEKFIVLFILQFLLLFLNFIVKLSLLNVYPMMLCIMCSNVDISTKQKHFIFLYHFFH